MSHDKPAPQPATNLTDQQPDAANDTGTSDRARRREAALRRLRKTTMSKRAAAALGITAIVAVVGMTTLGSMWGPTVPEMDTAAQAAELPATPALMVCPGAPVLPESAGDGGDLDFSPVSSDAVTALTVAAVSDLAGNIPGMAYFGTNPTAQQQPASAELTEPLDEALEQGPPATAAVDGTVMHRGHYDVLSEPDDVGNPIAVVTQPVGGSPGTASATSQFAATDGDLAGMTTAACTPAAHQQWLTGAITTPGTTAVLTITNPSATNSTVNLGVLGSEGPVEASGTSGIVLAPGQTRSMLVAGLAPRQDSVAVQVSASGGPVAAEIQQHRLDGIVPAGVDTLQPATAGPNIVIPGITIPDDAEEIAETSGLTGQTPMLHIASTGGAASATITLRGPDGPVSLPAAASAVDLAPGATTTVDFSDVTPGTYAVEIDATSNVIASATSLAFNPAADNEDSTGNIAAIDTAYMPSTGPIRGETLVSLPALGNPTAQLVLTSNDAAAVRITPIDDSGNLGETTTQELAANTAVTISNDDAAAYLLETGSNAVHAGVVVASSAGISAMPINTIAETGSGLPIRLGY